MFYLLKFLAVTCFLISPSIQYHEYKHSQVLSPPNDYVLFWKHIDSPIVEGRILIRLLNGIFVFGIREQNQILTSTGFAVVLNNGIFNMFDLLITSSGVTIGNGWSQESLTTWSQVSLFQNQTTGVTSLEFSINICTDNNTRLILPQNPEVFFLNSTLTPALFPGLSIPLSMLPEINTAIIQDLVDISRNGTCPRPAENHQNQTTNAQSTPGSTRPSTTTSKILSTMTTSRNNINVPSWLTNIFNSIWSFFKKLFY